VSLCLNDHLIYSLNEIFTRTKFRGSQPPRTRLRTAYQPPVQAHAVRDWISKHPRIAAPIALFLLGSLTYTVSILSNIKP
jgi:hypothetical protein